LPIKRYNAQPRKTPAIWGSLLGKTKRWRLILAALAISVMLGGGIAFADSRSHGPLWRAIYSLTGEESITGQVYGLISYLGIFTRRTPQTNTSQPVEYKVANPLGVNSFLELESIPSYRERQVQMMAEAGIGWIRQKFTWQDIEIRARGNFTDDRNDLNGDGTPDPIDAWLKYDNIVDLAQQYNIQIIARLGTPPQWSQAEGLKGTFAPPVDYQDFVNYAKAVAERYRGRVTHFQIWNEPNLSIEWGGQPVDPAAYTDLLCRTYRALKEVDPANKIISASLAPTVDISGLNLNPYVYLERMYAAGVKDCFDILGAQAYGLFSGPPDRRLRITTMNFGHPMWLRDLMISHGDGHKPIWIGEMAWNPVPTEAEIPDISQRLIFGQVSDAEAADYAVQAYERVRTEWSDWTGVVCYWFFKRPDESERNQSWFYFRMVDPDFTPRPVYESIKAYAAQMGYRK
jgi:polysaccharide biosynthesis protein PslG